MIEVKNIQKSFADLHVLKGINLHVNKGEIVAIIGKSGAGKTTLLQIIGTLDKPDQGQVIINGIDVFSLKDKELAQFRNHHIGFIFQFHQLLPEFTALENVMIPAASMAASLYFFIRLLLSEPSALPLVNKFILLKRLCQREIPVISMILLWCSSI